MNKIFPFKALLREQLEGALQKELFAELSYGGEAATKAALKGDAVIESKPGSPLSRSIQALAAQLIAEGKREGVNRGRKRGFFR